MHRRAREPISLMRERSAGGNSKSGRYKAHDTARKHVIDTIVSEIASSPHRLIV